MRLLPLCKNLEGRFLDKFVRPGLGWSLITGHVSLPLTQPSRLTFSTSCICPVAAAVSQDGQNVGQSTYAFVEPCDRVARVPVGVDIPEVLGHVHSTESFSAVDGPGVRFLVFLTGCPLRCLFCSNPDTWSLSSGAVVSSKVITSKLVRVKPYLANNGGITISGGDPLVQPQFVSALFQEAHSLGLNTCLDTSGQGSRKRSWDVVLPHTDMVLFCLKHLDPKKYEQLTGMKQSQAILFTEELTRRKIPFYLRYVLIPGITDSTTDLQLLVDFCKTQPMFQGVDLLPYHTLGKKKWEALNLAYPLEGVSIPSKKDVQDATAFLRKSGLPVVCNF